MRAATFVIAAFAAAAAAAPQQQQQQQQQQQPQGSPTGSAGAEPTTNGHCNLLSCAVSLGQAGLQCVEFAFGGSGPSCMQNVLKNVEVMPTACANCVNALLDPESQQPQQQQSN